MSREGLHSEAEKNSWDGNTKWFIQDHFSQNHGWHALSNLWSSKKECNELNINFSNVLPKIGTRDRMVIF